MTTERMSQDTFLAELATLSGHYWGSYPFHRRLHAGELTEAELRTWAAKCSTSGTSCPACGSRWTPM